MKRLVIVYGLALALLVFLLKWLEYRWLSHSLSIQFYLALLAMLFTGLGIWMGLRLTRTKSKVAPANPTESLRRLNISKREYEVLQLMQEGLSNQEIADRLFVSLNTVKTHSANLFQKLEVSRRTQAVRKAKAVGLLP